MVDDETCIVRIKKIPSRNDLGMYGVEAYLESVAREMSARGQALPVP